MRRQKNHLSFLITLLFLSILCSDRGFANSFRNPSSSKKTSKQAADHPEVERIRGFEEHQAQKKEMEKDREQGWQIHLERLEIEKREYQKSLNEYRKQKKSEKLPEETPAYRAQLEERRDRLRQAEKALEDYKKDKKEEAKLLKQADLDPMRELDLPENRPRFDYKQRSLYGGTPKFRRGEMGSSGMGFDAPPPPPTNFPPPQDNSFTPPGFDDFPPPPMDDSFDLPPPPPLPPMEGDLSIPQDDFFPPPPPPPPPMEDYQF